MPHARPSPLTLARPLHRFLARTITRATITRAQALSYLLNLPIACLAVLSGFTKREMESTFTAHLDCDHANQAVDKAVDMLLPQQAEYEKKVETAFTSCVNRQQAQDDCLFCARGTVRALRFIWRIVIRVAAARPRDAKGHILMEEKPIFEQFKGKNPVYRAPRHAATPLEYADSDASPLPPPAPLPLRNLTRAIHVLPGSLIPPPPSLAEHHVFTSDVFKEVCHIVREAEAAEMKTINLSAHERMARFVASPLAQRMETKLASPIANKCVAKLELTISTLQTNQQHLEEQIRIQFHEFSKQQMRQQRQMAYQQDLFAQQQEATLKALQFAHEQNRLMHEENRRLHMQQVQQQMQFVGRALEPIHSAVVSYTACDLDADESAVSAGAADPARARSKRPLEDADGFAPTQGSGRRFRDGPPSTPCHMATSASRDFRAFAVANQIPSAEMPDFTPDKWSPAASAGTAPTPASLPPFTPGQPWPVGHASTSSSSPFFAESASALERYAAPPLPPCPFARSVGGLRE